MLRLSLVALRQASRPAFRPTALARVAPVPAAAVMPPTTRIRLCRHFSSLHVDRAPDAEHHAGPEPVPSMGPTPYDGSLHVDPADIQFALDNLPTDPTEQQQLAERLLRSVRGNLTLLPEVELLSFLAIAPPRLLNTIAKNVGISTRMERPAVQRAVAAHFLNSATPFVESRSASSDPATGLSYADPAWWDGGMSPGSDILNHLNKQRQHRLSVPPGARQLPPPPADLLAGTEFTFFLQNRASFAYDLTIPPLDLDDLTSPMTKHLSWVARHTSNMPSVRSLNRLRKMWNDMRRSRHFNNFFIRNFIPSTIHKELAIMFESLLFDHPDKHGLFLGMALELERLQDQEYIQGLKLTPKEAVIMSSRLFNSISNAYMEALGELAANYFHPSISAYRNLCQFSDMRMPHAFYPQARSMKRKIIYHAGPTNSGKTFRAIQALRKSESGIFCGPLRLLALEVFDKLNQAGVPTSLLTGQEQKQTPGAQHASCTVEKACSLFPVISPVEVAVIDEIQLLADAQRGWAWTQAVLSAPAKEIHVCGDATAIDILQRITALTGDEFEVHEYHRRSQLAVEKSAFGTDFTKLERGDCVIAFSRRELHSLKTRIESETSHKCCIIYGRLPPETRAMQARLFNDPNSPYTILLASDAVGMGLNLNIRRIIFSTLLKFDGTTNVPLSTSHIKQIAGRAGRSSSDWDIGYVTSFSPEDLPVIKKALKTELESAQRAGLTPVDEQIINVASIYPELPLSSLVSLLLSTVQTDSNYFVCDTKELLQLADVIQPVPLTLEERLLFVRAPISASSDSVVFALKRFAEQYAEAKIVAFEFRMPFPSNSRKTLASLEEFYSIADLYLWLNQRLDGFVDALPAELLRIQASLSLNSMIAKADSKKPAITSREAVDPLRLNIEDLLAIPLLSALPAEVAGKLISIDMPLLTVADAWQRIADLGLVLSDYGQLVLPSDEPPEEQAWESAAQPEHQSKPTPNSPEITGYAVDRDDYQFRKPVVRMQRFGKQVLASRSGDPIFGLAFNPDDVPAEEAEGDSQARDSSPPSERSVTLEELARHFPHQDFSTLSPSQLRVLSTFYLDSMDTEGKDAASGGWGEAHMPSEPQPLDPWQQQQQQQQYQHQQHQQQYQQHQQHQQHQQQYQQHQQHQQDQQDQQQWHTDPQEPVMSDLQGELLDEVAPVASAASSEPTSGSSHAFTMAAGSSVGNRFSWTRSGLSSPLQGVSRNGEATSASSSGNPPAASRGGRFLFSTGGASGGRGGGPPAGQSSPKPPSSLGGWGI
ncbi:hypothetical protein H696_03553 [Fonticula alba]|uniref:RNA helicase n=1 Tax=Fonticula alba TaxID=691883 RepID=A0A058Z7L1_FONAL|nr:hypothetical protein H696_03553 [Fonticula alba]KCV70091.1 hypothetical protein H696_03553 [Fonticula alba]|eukprot:XP_009495697.1 hypothetical protein H696_03553 [Fonticula alba]